jgi:hypothetical protein
LCSWSESPFQEDEQTFDIREHRLFANGQVLQPGVPTLRVAVLRMPDFFSSELHYRARRVKIQDKIGPI